MQKLLLIGIMIIGISSLLKAQNPYPGETDLERGKRLDARTQSIVESVRRRNQGIRANTNTATEPTVLLENGKYKKIKRKITKENIDYITPNPTDRRKYESFLAQPDTGLIKLLPDIGCQKELVIYAASPCIINATIPGDGAAYSFRTEKYEEVVLSDLWLKDGKFKTGGFLTQGIIVKLNDSIENISLNSNGINFLTNFMPSKRFKEMELQKAALEKGVKEGVFVYSTESNALTGATYGLRSIAYRGATLWDKRNDVIIIFSIVRMDNDGSLTIVWKKLQEKKSPKIKNFNKSYPDNVYSLS